MDFNSSGFGSRQRSYPNLHHISLAPLRPRFPIDDDIDFTEYFNHGDTNSPKTSYLSSASMPSTPPILSHSRSESRTRLAPSRSSTRLDPLSDTNLVSRSRNLTLPPHHHAATHGENRSSSNIRNITGHANTKADAEWMLRTGIALASSTREEKGQSWLSKRESSTSLVTDMAFDDPTSMSSHRHHHHSKSRASSRKSCSGASTPNVYLTPTHRSRAGSRRGSRNALTMTSLPPFTTLSSATVGKTGVMSPEVRGRSTEPVPDFVDERVRAEMISLQQGHPPEEEHGRWDEENGNDSEYDYSSDDTSEEFDETDLQRLRRECGFGLGTWVDRIVEWMLFGMDELPVSVAPVAAQTHIGAAVTTTSITFVESEDTLSVVTTDAERNHESEGELSISGEKPGAEGGWEDATWLFRVAKRAFTS
ncbi:hypothetical protein N7495_000509 [Penicillium taxi]|uniref:uncharacterized protein n=1 Tax=Penicillium taxi TaxID=168475 RepID=UPI002544F04D|nr:uncharacterized protein N7495_000509 [Penicillium taxi]KAJ5907827.1 hypothetical protein N7495_000509 [Penicillium taxi]